MKRFLPFFLGLIWIVSSSSASAIENNPRAVVCSNFEGLRLDKMVTNINECSLDSCFAFGLGDIVFCNKVDDGSSPKKAKGISVCTEPNPFKYRAVGADKAGSCASRTTKCFIGDVSFTLCQSIKPDLPTPNPKIQQSSTPPVSSNDEIICSENDPNCVSAQGETCGEKTIKTALGCISTQLDEIVAAFMKLATGLGGGVALFIMVINALKMIALSNSQEQKKVARENFYSATIGLLFIIFAVLFMQLLEVDILNLPGFGK